MMLRNKKKNEEIAEAKTSEGRVSGRESCLICKSIFEILETAIDDLAV